jgi:Leu/Phe-tRNA-protein transferase
MQVPKDFGVPPQGLFQTQRFPGQNQESWRFLGGPSQTGQRGVWRLLDPTGRVVLARLSNPEAVRGVLPPGAEVGVVPGKGPEASGEVLSVSLELTENDFLPDDLAVFLSESSSWRATPWGVIFPLTGTTRWAYLEWAPFDNFDLVSFGPAEWRGFTGVLEVPTQTWMLRKRLVDRLFTSVPALPSVVSWCREGVTWVATPEGWRVSKDGEAIPELRFSDLNPEGVARLAQNLKRHYYWSDQWTPEFYALQARAGFIAITHSRESQVFLLPELQTHYAVLDWKNLHVGKTLRRWFRSAQAQRVSLVVSSELALVLDALETARPGSSWISPAYRELLEVLAKNPQLGVRGVGVELRWDGQLVAGEVGYTIGSTYTSLSGFHFLEKKEWSGLGTVQLVLLAKALEATGFEFWNLGHPQMEYKRALGARVLTRKEFLERWNPAVEKQTPALPL